MSSDRNPKYRQEIQQVRKDLIVPVGWFGDTAYLHGANTRSLGTIPQLPRSTEFHGMKQYWEL
ncbi:hypothetical protein N7491_007758 [Penicillium cf. griseofulvum]|uniref:Uncharacterized protein n=1 Tax=Penicillium cf. griseofulvum TaxID=2972120 RepID=A0A9W9M0R4_9EURO|nr:hypothetical protein N7472_009214 [Penicillium cf. griseofulvum]KAJ5430742.1 hypothetical protein N7491_007758 [Penicillium cf. griseofulvum]KAJ5435488.1 hypothetical protein N7445_006373 [Penicillium cf. griseofulvum]